MIHAMPPPSGFILVGGNSTRMGAPKGRLHFDGTPLLQHIAVQMRSVCRDVTLVGRGYDDFGLPVLSDARADFGPAAGILSALRTGPGWKLVVACDMPGVTGALLQRLADAAEASQDVCVLPRGVDGRNHPLCAVYSHSCLPAWEEAVTRGVKKVNEIVAGLAVTRLSIEDPNLLRNVNTPLEWQDFLNER